jgi:hypothetical protein
VLYVRARSVTDNPVDFVSNPADFTIQRILEKRTVRQASRKRWMPQNPMENIFYFGGQFGGIKVFSVRIQTCSCHFISKEDEQW